MHLSFSRSSAHSSFSVSTGGRTFISPSTPLGMCAHSTRYIPPVPPTYVSDYQANYRLYPPEYYGGTSRRPRTKTTEASGTRQNGNTMSDGRPRTESALFEDKWDDLLSSVNKLINKSFEENTLKSVREKVQARKLDAELEFAYRHCQDLLRSTANGQSAGHGELASHPHACVSHLPEDIRNLCKEFVQKVDALKSTR